MRVNRILMFRPEILNFCRGIPKSEENVDDRDRTGPGLFDQWEGFSFAWFSNPGSGGSQIPTQSAVQCHGHTRTIWSLPGSAYPRLLIGHRITSQASYWISVSGIISRVLPSPILLHISSEVIRRRNSEDVNSWTLSETSDWEKGPLWKLTTNSWQISIVTPRDKSSLILSIQFILRQCDAFTDATYKPTL